MDESNSEPNAAREYQRRLAAITGELRVLAAGMDRISNLRLAVFVLGLAWVWAAWRVHPLALLTLAAPLGAFMALVLLHERRLRRQRRMQVLQQFYEDGLARIGDRWMGRGPEGAEFLQEDHPFAADLDLFGPGSLFQLLCRARTRIGAATLAQWLLTPAQAETIAQRQDAVQALTPRLDLREALALEGLRIEADVRPDHLVHWVSAPRIFAGTRLLRAAQVLGAIGLASLVPLFFWGLLWPAILVLCINLLVLARVGRHLKELGAALEKPRRELDVLAGVIRRLEAEPFDTPMLRDLQARFQSGGIPASQAIASLDRLGYLYELQYNQLFAPLAVLLLWGVHIGYRLETWRVRWGKHVPEWLEALGHIEALSSLACHAWEREDAAFPEVVGEGPLFDAQALGHPLLPRTACVRNDLRLDRNQPLIIVSGSNMSGKSTLMRAVGINAALAMAGAPVCAKRLRMSPVMPGATMRVHDSIQSGVSRFYAEIKRLKDLLDLTAGSYPLLFLLDEILHGTNSHDRRIGAEAILRRLAEKGAIGLVSTHDLSITALDKSMGVPVVNAHFEDTVGETGPVFDYQLRPGVVQRSNALALMRAVGLEI